MAFSFRCELTNQLDSAVRPLVERLEGRQLLSASLEGGILSVVGTNANDVIAVRQSKLQGYLRVGINGQGSYFKSSDVEGIRIRGLGGDDDISIWEGNGKIELPTTIRGGTGDDSIVGGAGNDSIGGGAGNDWVYAARGNDSLRGNDGDDALNSGDGANLLFGNDGDDTLSMGSRDDKVIGGRGDDKQEGTFKNFFPIVTYTGNPEAAGYNPDQMRRAYRVGDLDNSSNTLDGRGQAIVIVDAFHTPRAFQDLREFSRQFDLPLPTRKNFQVIFANKRRPRGFDEGWNGESLLDIQWAHAIAPRAKIYLVEAQSNSSGDLFQAMQRGVRILNNNHGGGVISLSLGSNFDGENDRIFERIFSSPVARKVSWVVAAGDDGGVPAYPSTSPNVTSIGGTNLALDEVGQRLPNVIAIGGGGGGGGMVVASADSEVPWFNGGGGPSAVFAMPAYQRNRGIPGTMRATPDISWSADPTIGQLISIGPTPNQTGGSGGGVAIFNSIGSGGGAGWAATGGTSASAPQFAAVVALANQVRKQRRLPTIGNNLNNLIYSLAGRGSDFYFNDIADGANATFQATPGWDFATGWGSPNVHTLIPALAGIRQGQTIIDESVSLIANVNEFYGGAAGPLGGVFETATFRGEAILEGSGTLNLVGIDPLTRARTGSILFTLQSNNGANETLVTLEIAGFDVESGNSSHNNLVDPTPPPLDMDLVTEGDPITLFRSGNTVIGAADFIYTEALTDATTKPNLADDVQEILVGTVRKVTGQFRFLGTISGSQLHGKFIPVDIDGREIEHNFRYLDLPVVRIEIRT